MRFLIDAQLPPALASYLRSTGFEADHVLDLGLQSASDAAIGEFARTHSAVIVTKDQDFVAMRALRGEGPTVVWVRLGNTTTPALLSAVSRAWGAIVEALERGEDVVELRES